MEGKDNSVEELKTDRVNQEEEMKNNINPESANQTLENEDKNEQFESSNEENADENLEDEESTDDGDKKSGKFFKKKEKKKDPKDLKIEELEDRLKQEKNLIPIFIMR